MELSSPWDPPLSQPVRTLLDLADTKPLKTSPRVSEQAQKLTVRPWTIKIDGMVEKPMESASTISWRKLTLEERTYRHRSVEAWSMAIAWTGFPLPSWWIRAAARFGEIRRDANLKNTKEAPGSGRPGTVALYRRPHHGGGDQRTRLPRHRRLCHSLAKQHGAPLRLAVAVKYGFKSIKSIVRLRFTDKRPKGMWEALQSSNTASGPTSIRRCRIRAGARRAKK